MADSTNQVPEEKKPATLTDQEWKRIAEYVKDEWQRRKGAREAAGFDQQWAEIDRQVSMTPRPRVDAEGRPLSAGTEWMFDLELHLQAQALEMLTADTRRLLFPSDRNFYSAHAALDDKVLQAIEEDDELIPGMTPENLKVKKEGDLVMNAAGKETGIADQELVDAIVEGVLDYFHGLYDMRTNWDLTNGDAFKYGTWAARCRRVSYPKAIRDYRGVAAERKIGPVFIPRPIKNVYLDDTAAACLLEGMHVAPGHIEWWRQNIYDLKMAAMKGDSSPTNENGGWCKQDCYELEPVTKTDTMVDLLEFEGDMIVPRSDGGSIYLPNCIVTVAIGFGGPCVCRYREREFDFNSYLIGNYHRPDMQTLYGDGPLKYGYPLQRVATEGMNRLGDVAALHAMPPVKWDPSDFRLAAAGGPRIAPGAMWESTGKVEVVEIGDPKAMALMVQAMNKAHEDATGVNNVRLGGQIKSHTTASANDQELTRGLVRTVDYCTTLMDGPMTSFLYMEWEMARKSIPAKGQMIYIPKLSTYLLVKPEHLPETVWFEVHGAAGPLEEREAQMKKMNALMLVLKTLPLAQQAGAPMPNIGLLQRKILTDGGWTDLDEVFGEDAGGTQGGAVSPQGQPGLPEGVNPLESPEGQQAILKMVSAGGG